jgi:phosphoribosyl 1,2-cyclic phosphate phosphodiesterase
MKATLTVLGSGTSMGVPTIGCDCAVCTSADPRDRRTRPSVMVQWDDHTVLIDTTPDFRYQAIREGIRKIDAVLYTHGHADHILGLDDVRPLSFPRITGGGKIPLYASENTTRTIEGYRFGNAAYLTDFSTVPDESLERLEGLDILFLDALRHHPHPTHSTVENSLKIADRLKAKRTYFTHISHDLPHEATNAALPENVRLSHDGLKLEFDL